MMQSFTERETAQSTVEFQQRYDPTFSSNWTALWNESPDDVLLVKFTYWLSP